MHKNEIWHGDNNEWLETTCERMKKTDMFCKMPSDERLWEINYVTFQQYNISLY